MPTCCAVPGCHRRGGHTFPRNPQRRAKWTEAVKREKKWQPTVNSVVCSQHFEEDDYRTRSPEGLVLLNRLLKKEAVPSVFPWQKELTPAQKNRKERARAKARKQQEKDGVLPPLLPEQARRMRQAIGIPVIVIAPQDDQKHEPGGELSIKRDPDAVSEPYPVSFHTHKLHTPELAMHVKQEAPPTSTHTPEHATARMPGHSMQHSTGFATGTVHSILKQGMVGSPASSVASVSGIRTTSVHNPINSKEMTVEDKQAVGIPRANCMGIVKLEPNSPAARWILNSTNGASGPIQLDPASICNWVSILKSNTAVGNLACQRSDQIGQVKDGPGPVGRVSCSNSTQQKQSNSNTVCGPSGEKDTRVPSEQAKNPLSHSNQNVFHVVIQPGNEVDTRDYLKQDRPSNSTVLPAVSQPGSKEDTRVPSKQAKNLPSNVLQAVSHPSNKEDTGVHSKKLLTVSKQPLQNLYPDGENTNHSTVSKSHVVSASMKQSERENVQSNIMRHESTAIPTSSKLITTISGGNAATGAEKLNDEVRSETGNKRQSYVPRAGCSGCRKRIIYYMMRDKDNNDDAAAAAAAAKPPPTTATECEHCGRKLTHMRRYVQNGRVYRCKPKRHACTTCGKSFTAGSLRLHMRVHTGEKPHPCAECGKKFRSLWNLKQHMIVHTGETPFLCQVCGKQFQFLWNLQAHARTHTGEKPFQCHVCGQTFAYDRSLKKHLQKHEEMK